MEAKSILKSKLFWLGAVNIIIGILTYISGALNDGGAITLNGILIIVLRYLTIQPVKLK